MSLQPYRWFRVHEAGGVTVVRFTHRGDRTGEAVEAVAEQLDRLVDEEGRLHLLLNLANVERVASAMLGRFVTLHRKALAGGGRLKSCVLSPAVQEVFTTARLVALFGIYPTE
jgi:anti-sigma B factor antagonist